MGRADFVAAAWVVLCCMREGDGVLGVTIGAPGTALGNEFGDLTTEGEGDRVPVTDDTSCLLTVSAAAVGKEG